MNNKRGQYFLCLALSWATLFLLYGCAQNASTSSEQIFCYNESNGITSLDPAFSRDLEVMWATNQLFDGLVELDSGLNVIPSIARRWEISEDGLCYTFYLRDSVFFHPSQCFSDGTGRQVIAEDFVYSFNRLLDPKIASPAQWIFANVDTENHQGFYANNDSTLSIYLKQPFAPFLGMLSMQYCNVVPHEVVEYYGIDFRAHPIGSGPFKFAFWYENEALVFHRNDHFWQSDSAGKKLPYLNAVKIEFVKDMSVEFQGLLQGRYDFMSGISASFKDELLDAGGELAEAYSKTLRFQKCPFVKTDYLGILMDKDMEIMKNSPLQDLKVRQAIAYAINKMEMVKYLRNNTVTAAEIGFVPPTLLPKSPTSLVTHNVEKAKALLAEAGYPEGKGMPILTISTVSDYADLIEYIQHELEKIGVRIRVNILQGPALREQSAKGQLEIFRKSWLADYADPENFLAVFYSKNFCPVGPNYTHFYNPQYDALYEAARIEKNDSTRFKSYAAMDSILMEEVPVIPLYYDQVSHFIQKNVDGLQTNKINMLDLKTVSKKTGDR